MSPRVPRPAGVPSVRVVQLNAGSLLEPDWEARRHEVVAWIDALAPDVVCLQEVWVDGEPGTDGAVDTAGWVADRSATDWHRVFGGGRFSDELWPGATLRFGSAVLSRWPITAHEEIPLPIAGDADLVTRGVPWEVLHVRTDGLDVFSCHLTAPPTHGHHRRLQVVALDDAVRRIRGDLDAPTVPGAPPRDAVPPIICGDFNAEPDSDEMRFLTGLGHLDGRRTYYQDAWKVAGDGPGWTQDWRVNPIAALLNVPRKRIDYVLVGDPFQRAGGAGRVLAAQRAFDEPLTGVIASDHCGLVVDVQR